MQINSLYKVCRTVSPWLAHTDSTGVQEGNRHEVLERRQEAPRGISKERAGKDAEHSRLSRAVR